MIELIGARDSTPTRFVSLTLSRPSLFTIYDLRLLDYFGSKLHWLGMSPLNSKFAPTTIGLSEVTLTVIATPVTPSKPGPLVVGITQSTSRVCPAASARVVLPASPGYVRAGLEPGMVTPVRLAPFLSRMFTAMFAVLLLPLKT